jgi:peptidoglycan/xylan/chitin deacetylase (PgdA/CDA1 family)
VEPPSPTTSVPGAPAEVVRHLPTEDPVIALTFDGGSDRGYTDMILHILEEEGIDASFGLTGNWASQNLDAVERMVDSGYDLINHTYSHRSWTGVSDGQGGLSTDERRDEVESTEEVFAQAGGSALPYFRSPYGDYDDSVQADLGTFGYRYNFLWAVDTRGWAGASADEIVQRVLDGLAPGAVIVLHVGSTSQDGPALEALIDAVREAGYGFTAVSDYLE